MFLIVFAFLLVGANCQFPLYGPALYKVADVSLNIAESPSWDPRTNTALFVDVFNSKVFNYNPKTKEVHSIPVPGLTATPIILTENKDIIVVGVNSSIIAIEWDRVSSAPKKQKVLATVGPKYELPLLTAFNDGKADKNGNIWIGTTIKNFSSENVANGAYLDKGGALYRITKDNLSKPEVKLVNITLTNGMTWSLADDKFFYIDSVTRQVVQYDFVLKSGELSNPQVVLDLKDHPDIAGLPDGVTVDKDDNLWVSLYGGGSIIKVNPKTKKVLQRLAVPAKHVTSGIWAGPKYDELIVTTASRILADAEKPFYPDAGDVFAFSNVGTSGKQTYYTNVVDSL